MFSLPLKKNMREINSTITIGEKDKIEYNGKDLALAILSNKAKTNLQVFLYSC